MECFEAQANVAEQDQNISPNVLVCVISRLCMLQRDSCSGGERGHWYLYLCGDWSVALCAKYIFLLCIKHAFPNPICTTGFCSTSATNSVLKVVFWFLHLWRLAKCCASDEQCCAMSLIFKISKSWQTSFDKYLLSRGPTLLIQAFWVWLCHIFIVQIYTPQFITVSNYFQEDEVLHMHKMF